MVQITDIFSAEALEAALRDGYVRRQVHPRDPDLVILNYTEKAQFDREWNDVTKACRGLIYRLDTGSVVARPFSKFPNWDESGWPYPPSGPVVIMPKMDGSLGIIYADDAGVLAIATRGSFASEQAVRATSILQTYLEGAIQRFRASRTYLFEIIYPENRIVVDYGSDEKLVLLDIIDTATGLPDMAEFDNFDWPYKVNRRLESKGFSPQLLEEETLEGDEGIVCLWPATGYRVKVKRADYVHLHRMIFGLSERKVWEAMCSGVDVGKFAEPLPDEFHDWVRVVYSRIAVEQHEICKHAYMTWAEIRSGLEEPYTRKEFALHAVQHDNRALLFLLEDNRDIKQTVLESLRPDGNIYATRQSEDTA